MKILTDSSALAKRYVLEEGARKNRGPDFSVGCMND